MDITCAGIIHDAVLEDLSVRKFEFSIFVLIVEPRTLSGFLAPYCFQDQVLKMSDKVQSFTLRTNTVYRHHFAHPPHFAHLYISPPILHD